MEKVPYVQWTDISRQNSTKSGETQFLRIKTGQTYRIRPLCTPVKFKRLFNRVDGKYCTAICTEGIEDALPYTVRSSKRCAFYVLDRSDSTIKILEAPFSVLRSIQTSAALSGRMPDNPETGSDYAVRMSGTGPQTQYYVVSLEETPLTTQERAAVATMDMYGTLETLYRNQPLQEIRERLKL